MAFRAYHRRKNHGRNDSPGKRFVNMQQFVYQVQLDLRHTSLFTASISSIIPGGPSLALHRRCLFPRGEC